MNLTEKHHLSDNCTNDVDNAFFKEKIELKVFNKLASHGAYNN